LERRLPSGPRIIGRCAKRGHSTPERAVEQDLLRRVGEVVVAADDVVIRISMSSETTARL
jgi:hypothetical protein